MNFKKWLIQVENNGPSPGHWCNVITIFQLLACVCSLYLCQITVLQSQGCVPCLLCPIVPFNAPAAHGRQNILWKIVNGETNTQAEEQNLCSSHLFHYLVQKRRAKYLQFQNQCSEVAPGLFASGESVAMDKTLLTKHGITHVINCSATCQTQLENLKYLQHDLSGHHLLHLWLIKSNRSQHN